MSGNVFSNSLYSFVELQRQFMEPYRQVAMANKEFYEKYFAQTKLGRSIAASYELFERVTRHYPKPEFDILSTKVHGKDVKVVQKTIVSKTFCQLLHFEKKGSFNLPKLLVVAPMSGHYATLLRGTVEGLLPHFDVYITDWVNARDVPLGDGKFHFDDFVNYLREFLHRIGKDTNIIAVCQPAVPVSVAVTLMSQEKDPYLPPSFILMGGPIDTRQNPTEVNDYAAERTIHWFENNVITKVPLNYSGAGRLVYPGFTQLYGFMAMNLQMHVEAHWDLFNHLVEGDGESAEAHRQFYNEYLSVMDMPAEFYLETVDIVFKQHLLPRGKLVSNGQTVDMGNIKNSFLLCIEGERDDISGRGQTRAALRLCSGIPDDHKEYYLQKDVGHYGIFNGRRYREQVVPKICQFVGEAMKYREKKEDKPTTAKAKTKAAPKVKTTAIVKPKKGKTK